MRIHLIYGEKYTRCHGWQKVRATSYEWRILPRVLVASLARRRTYARFKPPSRPSIEQGTSDKISTGNDSSSHKFIYTASRKALGHVVAPLDLWWFHSLNNRANFVPTKKITELALKTMNVSPLNVSQTAPRLPWASYSAFSGWPWRWHQPLSALKCGEISTSAFWKTLNWPDMNWNF